MGGELEIKIRYDVPTVLPPPRTRPLTPGAIRLDSSHSLDSFTSIFFKIRQKLNEIDDIDGGHHCVIFGERIRFLGCRGARRYYPIESGKQVKKGHYAINTTADTLL